MNKLLIIGGGPAGLTAAIYSARAGLNPIVAAGSIDGTNIPGGQLMITTEVENFPGFPDGIEGPELMERMRAQAEKFGTVVIEEFVKSVVKVDDHFHVVLDKQELDFLSIIIATGSTAKWLKVKGEEEYKNKGISACAVCDGALPCFRNKVLVVAGGGDTAMEEATHLSKFASKVIILVRTDTLKASLIMQDRVLKNSKIEIMYNSSIKECLGDGHQLTGLLLNDDKILMASGLFVAIGHQPMTSFLKDSGVQLNSTGYIVRKDKSRTNVDGIFVAGDVHDQRYCQAITASGYGCQAALEVENWL